MTMITGLFVLLSLLCFSGHARRIITVDDSVPFWTENEEPKEIEMSMPGGIGNEIEADESVQTITTKVQDDVQTKVGKTYEKFDAVKYCTQVVAGINYFIKVQVGDDDYIHVRVFKNLKQVTSLSAVQEGKTKDDKITYF